MKLGKNLLALALGLGVMLAGTWAQASITTPAGKPNWGAGIETSGPYYVNTWAAVLGSPHGSSSYSYIQWHELEFTSAASQCYNWDKTAVPVVGNLDDFSLRLYNTATSGNYRPYAGNFDIYFIPNDSYNLVLAAYKGTAGTVGYNALGTLSGDYTSLGISASDPLSYKVGTWSITDSLPLGYTTFSVDGSLIGSAAKTGMIDDLNNGTPMRFALVAADSSFACDWEGNYSSNYPQLSFGVSAVPEPATIGLLVVGGVASLVRRRRNRVQG
jgi:hypothetical protein